MKITQNVDLRFSPVVRNGGNHRIPDDTVRVSLNQLSTEYTVDEVLYSTPKVVVQPAVQHGVEGAVCVQQSDGSEVERVVPVG